MDSEETILAAQDFFMDVSFSHFPVLEDGIYLGSIVAEDIETFDTDKKILHTILEYIELININSPII